MIIGGRNTHFSPCEAGLPGPWLTATALAAREVHHPAVLDDPEGRSGMTNDETRMTNQIRNPNTETEARRSTQRLSTGGSDFVIRNSFAIRASLFGFSAFLPQSV